MGGGAHLKRECGMVLSHTLRNDFYYETYIGIRPYRTLAVVELQCMAVISCVT